MTLNHYFSFWSGVDLFFAISGFVITRDLIRKLDELSPANSKADVVLAFWVRRIWRIWPTSYFWIILILAATVTFNKYGNFGSLEANFADFVSISAQTQNIHFWYCINYTHVCGVAATWWSLSLEEQFYMLLPFALVFFRKWVPAAFGFLILAQFFIPRQTWDLLWVIRTEGLMFGVLLALATRKRFYIISEPRLLTYKRYAGPILIFLIFLLIAIPANHDGKAPTIPFSTGMVSIISIIMVWIASYDRNYFYNVVGFKNFFMWLGSRSYALYIVHGPVLIATNEIWRRLLPNVSNPSGNLTFRYLSTFLALTVILSELNYRCLEVPLRATGLRISKRISWREGSEGCSMPSDGTMEPMRAGDAR